MIETWAIDLFGSHLVGLFFTVAMGWCVIFSWFMLRECDDANELIATRILGRRARKEIPEATAPFLIDRK